MAVATIFFTNIVNHVNDTQVVLPTVSFEVEGKLHRKFDTEQKTDSFRAREFVLEIEGQYPQMVKFQLTQDRCDLIDAYDEGNQLKANGWTCAGATND